MPNTVFIKILDHLFLLNKATLPLMNNHNFRTWLVRVYCTPVLYEINAFYSIICVLLESSTGSGAALQS